MHIAPIFPYSEPHEANCIIKLHKLAQKLFLSYYLQHFFYYFFLQNILIFLYNKGSTVQEVTSALSYQYYIGKVSGDNLLVETTASVYKQHGGEPFLSHLRLIPTPPDVQLSIKQKKHKRRQIQILKFSTPARHTRYTTQHKSIILSLMLVTSLGFYCQAVVNYF